MLSVALVGLTLLIAVALLSRLMTVSELQPPGETIKNIDEPTIPVGHTMSFSEIAGDLSVGGKRVVALLRWARLTQVDHEYLVFWSLNFHGPGMKLDPTRTFERQGSRWVRLHSGEHYGGVEELGRGAGPQ